MTGTLRDPADSAGAITLTPGQSLGGAAVVFLCWLTFGPAFAALFGADGSGSRQHVEGMLLGAFGGNLIALAVAFLWLWRADLLGDPARGRARVAQFVGSRAEPLSTVAAYLAFLLAWVPISFFVVPALWHALGLELGAQAHLAWFADFTPSLRSMLCLLAVGLSGPIFEEVVFRGFLQGGLRSLFGPRTAWWVTALAFGAIHMPDSSCLLIPITLLGLFFGWLRERTGGVRASILAHALHNSAMLAIVIADPQLLEMTFKR